MFILPVTFHSIVILSGSKIFKLEKLAAFAKINSEVENSTYLAFASPPLILLEETPLEPESEELIFIPLVETEIVQDGFEESTLKLPELQVSLICPAAS